MSEPLDVGSLCEQFHLAEFIEEELKTRGLTLRDMVMRMGPFSSEGDWAVCQLSWEMFMVVRDVNCLLGEEMANQLAKVFGCSPQFFTNMHESWRAWKQRQVS